MTEVDISWLEGALKSRGKVYDVAKLVSVDDVTPAVSEGDNYVSKIYRLSLTVLTNSGKQTKCSLIMKRKVDMDSEYPELNQKISDAFNKEYQVYANTLIKLEKYLSKTETVLWPDCLGTIPNKDIYFEDLKASGYGLASRMDGLDSDHCLLAFRSLARFHAASYLAISRGELDTTPYDKYLIIRASSEMRKMKSNAYAMMIDVIRKEWEPEWENIADRLEKLSESLPEIVQALGDIDENRINVLNHGDTWVNNYMFKWDSNGKPVSLKFVDFQITHYNSFGFDMCYLLGTSINPDLKMQHLNTWIRVYCQTFSQCLEEHGCNLPCPTPVIVRQELTRLAPFLLNTSLRIRPMIMIPSEESIPISELIKDTGLNSKKRRLYTNPKYVKVMKMDLPSLLSNAESVINACK